MGSCITVKNLIQIKPHLENVWPHVGRRLPLIYFKDSWWALVLTSPNIRDRNKYYLFITFRCHVIKSSLIYWLMNERHAQQVIKVWEFSNSDISNELLVQKYRIALSFLCFFFLVQFKYFVKGLPQQVVKIWKFCTSDITCLFFVPKCGRLQRFTRSFSFVITLFIFGRSGHTREQLPTTGGLKGSTRI